MLHIIISLALWTGFSDWQPPYSSLCQASHHSSTILKKVTQYSVKSWASIFSITLQKLSLVASACLQKISKMFSGKKLLHRKKILMSWIVWHGVKAMQWNGSVCYSAIFGHTCQLTVVVGNKTCNLHWSRPTSTCICSLIQVHMVGLLVSKFKLTI